MMTNNKIGGETTQNLNSIRNKDRSSMQATPAASAP